MQLGAVADEVAKVLSGEVIDPMPPSGRVTAKPMQRMGVPGYAVTNGYILPTEVDGRLNGRERYRVFSQNFVNVAIIGTAVRYFLDLIAGAAWTFEPAEKTSQAQEVAEFFKSVFENMVTSHPRIMRRAAMYKMYGFSIQEIGLKPRDDGRIGILDIQPRPQKTIERWDIDNVTGLVRGVFQRNPNNGRELYVPREKMLYITDDSLSDSPEGLGLFRHAIRGAAAVMRFEDLEMWGFETDLQGIPIGRVPYAALEKAVADGAMTRAEMQIAVATIEGFIANHIKGPKTGLALDSQTYETSDERAAPSAQRLWDLELLQSGGTSHAAINDAIKRKTFELARLFGVEHLLIGSDGGGSLALHTSSTKRLHAMVNAALDEVRDAEQNDVVKLLARVNSVPEALTPKLKFEKVAYRSIEEVTAALANMATAGAPLMPTDPAVGEVRDMIGLSRPEESDVTMAGIERLVGLGLPMEDKPDLEDDAGNGGGGGQNGQGRRQGGGKPSSRGNGGSSRSGAHALTQTLTELSAYLEAGRESR